MTAVDGMPEGPEGVVREVIAACEDAKVPVLLLSWPRRRSRFTASNPYVDEVHLLVPRRRVGAARAVLERLPWRLEVGNRGPWRASSKVSYAFGQGVSIHLHWGLPASPLPSITLRGLEGLLWERATTATDGIREPDAASLFLFLAIQAARPGFPVNRREWARQLRECADQITDWDEIRELAHAFGISATLRRALLETDVGNLAGSSIERSGVRDAVWYVTSWFLEHVRPARIRPRLAPLLEGTPMLGRATARCRFHDVELLAGRGVFVPMPISEPLVPAALEAIEGMSRAIAVETGTGCGAVSLALASAHPGVEVHAVELMPKALRWARVNRRRLRADRVHLYRGSLLEPLPSQLEGKVDVLIANLPYVPPARAKIERDVIGAVVGHGKDGLGLQRELVRQARAFLRPGGRLVLQLAAEQWSLFSEELRLSGYRPGDVFTETATDLVVGAERLENDLEPPPDRDLLEGPRPG